MPVEAKHRTFYSVSSVVVEKDQVIQVGYPAYYLPLIVLVPASVMQLDAS